MTKSKSRRTIETFLTLFLLIVFTYFIAVMVIESKHSFDRVSKNKTQDEDVRIALSYVQKILVKNDSQGAISLEDVDGRQVLRINHDDTWSTYIYFEEGYLYEQYTDKALDFSLSRALVALKDLSFDFAKDKGQILTHVLYEYQGDWIEITQKTSLKSVGE